MGEGHSNTTGHGARGPTGGVKGGPAGPGGPGSNRGQGWGTSQTPYGAIHHYSPSQFGHSSQRGGGVVAIVAVRQRLRIWHKTRNYKPIWLWEGCQPLSP